MQGYKIWPRKACLIEEETYRNVDKATAATLHFGVQLIFFIFYVQNFQAFGILGTLRLSSSLKSNIELD